MTSIKVKYRPSAVAGNDGCVYYQITHLRKVRNITSGIRLAPALWDDAHSMPETDGDRETLMLDIARMRRAVSRLESAGTPFDADDVVREYVSLLRRGSFSSFMRRQIDGFRRSGRIRTSETYQAALCSFTSFRSDSVGGKAPDIAFDAFTPGLMEDYQIWMRGRGLVPNTVSFYFRILRAVYNRAVEQGLTDDKAPFRHVYTGIDKTVKRAVTIPLMRKIRNLDLGAEPCLDYARDMFMMSFYLRGMSFVDMAFLHKSDLACGRITYRRRKTGRALSIRWTPEMQAIVDKYPSNSSDYLLPVITAPCANERSHYRAAAFRINSALKRIAAIIGIDIPLTLYVARHSWASAARSKGVDLSVISEGMGHTSEATTRIYLASLDTATIDRANSLIIGSL